MARRYQPREFEAKWQQAWQERGQYRTEDELTKPKFYCLDFFPYPSGAGLSVGHAKNYVPTDVYSRFKRMNGYNVLHPMGWDAFGLPAENEAIQRQVPPRVSTARNTANYKRQMNMMGLSYDWSREINSSDPEYYRWTQWFFLLLHRRGLAYRAPGSQWWCPVCKTILANEQVVNGFCWRHGDTPVQKKELEQWYFKITDYADQLLDDLDSIEWPAHIVAMQRNWIGRSEGAEVTFRVAGSGQPVVVFTTRPDTLFGATFIVLSPEHPLVDQVSTPQHRAAVQAYQEQARLASEIERLSTEREKTGVFTGAYAINPVNGEQLPIWIADYVLMGYGTGAIMAVPAHDQRDFEFARRFDLPIKLVYQDDAAPQDAGTMTQAMLHRGHVVNSGQFNGLADGPQAVDAFITWLEEQGTGKRRVNYRIRDWLISRQRYWGAPIPIVYCDRDGIVPVPEEQLPVLLPEIADYEPSGTGRSPLANLPEFVNTTCPACGGPARRETDTIDGFGCSSWYFLRYPNPHDTVAPFDRQLIDYWLPVDTYVGGAEHAVMHLLYARFWTKVMADAGLVNFREPFARLRNQGVIYGSDGHRMSKSRGNVVTPDEVIETYGADALRCFELFMGPFEMDNFWDEDGPKGQFRFLHRVWELAGSHPAGGGGDSPAVLRLLHQTIQDVTERIEDFRFNTVVSKLHELLNALERQGCSGDTVDTLLLLLAPIAPHLTEELWSERHPGEGSIHSRSWPVCDPALLVADTCPLVIQVNGKVRDTLQTSRDLTRDDAEALARASERVQRFLDGHAVQKVIFVPNKLLNLVVS
ncbi:MAG TPA: leucine--tRNA ligase [Chloroflexota bacterium]|nr:leucine--tRNA ligase [Chloroflexota bacterium]